MSNQYQTNYDLNKIVELSSEIIKNRKFELLLELNDQCELWYNQQLLQLLENNIPENFINGLDYQEDVVFLLLYYIYYIYLKEEERNIFVHLQDVILWKNRNLYANFSTFDKEQLEQFSANEQQCFKYSILIMQKYANLSSVPKMDEDFSNLNDFIYTADKEQFRSINNDCYLAYMLALGVLDYKKVLSAFAYDIVIQRLVEVANIVMEMLSNPINLMFTDETNNSLEQDIEELRF